MACSCKNGSTLKQITTVKQVVKSTNSNNTSNSQNKVRPRRIIFRRPI